MSNLPVQPSTTASAPPDESSVYDFLYHDPLRIASFLAQFDPNGVVQSLKRTHQIVQSSQEGTKGSFGVSAGFLKGQLGEDLQINEGSNEGSERVYDPVWSNARAFLDYIEQRGLLNRSLSKSRIGQFTLVKGKLWMLDMSMLKNILSNSTLKKALRSGLPAAKKVSGGNTISEADLIMEFMPLLPHGIQARMVDILNKSVWFSLREDGLSTSPGDVFLKHGSNIAGDWNVVGIVDALPSNGYQPKSPFEDGMQKAIADLGSNLRPAFGRPNDAWGMTPLLIFREVSET